MTDEKAAEVTEEVLEQQYTELVGQAGMAIDLAETAYDRDAPLKPAKPSLKPMLYRLREIAQAKARLDDDRNQIYRDAMPMLLAGGGAVMFADPTSGESLIAAPAQAETLEVNLPLLRSRLFEHYSALRYPEAELTADQAESVWMEVLDLVESVLKPPVVDTTMDGKYERAVKANLIPTHIVAEVSRFKKNAAYIGITAPKHNRKA